MKQKNKKNRIWGKQGRLGEEINDESKRQECAGQK